MHPRQIDLVLFDLDNTLIPFLPAVRAWARAWARPLVPPDKRARLAEELVEHTLEHGEDPRRGVQQAVARWNLHLHQATLDKASAQAREVYRRALDPYPGVPETLAGLDRAGFEMAIVTDAPEARATERLAATGLDRRFEVVVTRDDSPKGKRGPEPFHTALRAMGAPASATAMVGDWPTYDVKWPKRLGMRTVLAGWGARNEERPRNPAERPWAVADHPRELEPLLRGEADPSPLATLAPQGVKPLTAF